MFGDRFRRLGDVGRQNHLGRIPGEGRTTREELVRQRPDGIDVGPVIDVGSCCGLLRCHIGGSAESHARRGEFLPPRRFTHRFGYAEVRHQCVAVGQHDIVRFDVAVHHALGVRLGEGIHHVPENPHDFGDGQLALPHQLLPQRLAVDVWQDIIKETVGVTRVDQHKDVGVIELGGDLDLAKEPLGSECGREFGAQNLHGHLPVVLHVLGQIDRRHTAGTDFVLDGVAVGESSFQSFEGVRHRWIRCDLGYDRARFAEFGALLGPFDEKAAPRGDPKML